MVSSSFRLLEAEESLAGERIPEKSDHSDNLVRSWSEELAPNHSQLDLQLVLSSPHHFLPSLVPFVTQGQLSGQGHVTQ